MRLIFAYLPPSAIRGRGLSVDKKSGEGEKRKSGESE